MARRGYLAFRFDLEGIGDSISIGHNPENNAYSPVALADISDALKWLTTRFGCTEFVVAGICAGAYHAFKSAAALPGIDIRRAILINPLTYEFDYVHSRSTHSSEAIAARATWARDPERWRRLLTGRVHYGRVALNMLEYATRKVTSFVRESGALVVPALGSAVSRDLKTIRGLNRRLDLICADGDPGLDLLLLQARSETKAAIRNGDLTVYSIENANHGFSKKCMQERLVQTVVGLDTGDSS